MLPGLNMMSLVRWRVGDLVSHMVLCHPPARCLCVGRMGALCGSIGGDWKVERARRWEVERTMRWLWWDLKYTTNVVKF